VVKLYNNVLNRDPDAGGLAFWVDQLNAGTLTRPQVLTGFSESAENKAALLPAIGNGIAFRAGAVVLGTPAGDSLSGTGSPDSISGGDGRDVLTGLGGNDRIDGGTDLDVAVYRGERSLYAATLNGADLAVTDSTGLDGADLLVAVERLQFADLNLAFDINGNAGQAYRLYKAAFDRTPDTGGLSFWIDAIDDGATLLTVAEQFLLSPEFQSTYGANPTNEAFIDLLYRNVLDRLPDQSGYDFWLDAFSRGLTRAGALVEFSESAENQANLIGVLQQGIEYLPLG